MNNDDHISGLLKSSLYVPVKSQANRHFDPLNLLDKNRRKSIIPVSHLPTRLHKLSKMDNEQAKPLDKDYLLEETEKSVQLSDSSILATQLNKNYAYNETLPTDNIENNTDKEEHENENSFGSFILQNFIPFSDEQDVNLWLNETEEKFNQLFISRNLRFTAVPLLVKGHAKKVYIRNRRSIQSFDDFYEILLLHFDEHDAQSTANKPQETILLESNSLHQTKSADEKSLQAMATLDNTQFSEQLPKHHLTQLNEFSAAATSGVSQVSQSTSSHNNNTSNNDASHTDYTTNVLRQVLLQNLVQNPKIFQGGKEDVTKWLEDIERLFDAAHISNVNKLDLISCSLRGEALRWYKNNKTMLTSWEIFVSELKKAFTSSYHQELAFKKLETFTQGTNQSIQNFYNEVLKLCNEADPTMSESAKLRNLLNKTKPTIQFEVRRKKPTSTREFLEYAKELEDLYQLSNINTNETNISLTSTSTIIPSLVNNSNSLSQSVSISALEKN